MNSCIECPKCGYQYENNSPIYCVVCGVHKALDLVFPKDFGCNKWESKTND